MATVSAKQSDDSLVLYRSERDVARRKPSDATLPTGGNSFFVHKHAASRLHYDCRLELDDVLSSWAVTPLLSLMRSA
ncbi:DNA polymerase Ligase (LigD) [Sphingobium sp. YR768]|nr:DNA polymerase ligase N-terminal domain-containing protein [Sphingobium sp. YR768]SES17558.1 DNA polymerase Ligase (LigD) [Sphingobium sp. YR768]